ncbi:MAG: hypothetical protein ABJK11_14825 [Balneola sp.]
MAEEYYQPDSRWEMHGITSKELHKEHAVIKGYFHEGVPEDVVKEFTTTEYLMAHAYYYWPMYDEALTKSIFTVEVAIKLKAIQNNIPLKFKTKKGKKRDRRLVDIINDLFPNESYSEFLDELHKIREHRNMKAHPKHHGFAGPNGADHYIRYMVNTLNKLFWSEKKFIAYNKEVEKISPRLKSLNDGVLKLEDKERAYLLAGLNSFDIIGESLVISVLPMRVEYHSSKEGFNSESPKILSLRKYHVTMKECTGYLSDGSTITISVTDKLENINAKEERDTYIEQLNDSQKMVFYQSLNVQTSYEMIKVQYDYYRQKY